MIDVVLPVLDEAAAIPLVLASLPAGFTALVVDNGSTDGSADVARDGGARVGQCRRTKSIEGRKQWKSASSVWETWDSRWRGG